MAHYGGVTVRVITNDKLCPMYDDPDADGHEDPFSESSPPQKYIEAVTGAKFAVVVTLDLHFQYGDCDAVRAKVYFDGTSRNHGTKLHLKSKDANGGSLKKRTMRFSSLTSYCPQTAQFQKGNLTFGELKMNETSDSTHSLSEVKDLGQIRVVWKRAYLGEETVRPPRTDRIRKIPEVSEKLLKGKVIENVVELSNLQQVDRTSNHKRTKWIGLLGPEGREMRINILYRSKRTLQMLGCVPRSPSPIPQESHLEEAVTKPDDPQEQLRALRAQLAELENRITNTPQSIVKSEQLRLTSTVKREREDNENEVKQKRSRKSGPPEVVDLTAD